MHIPVTLPQQKQQQSTTHSHLTTATMYMYFKQNIVLLYAKKRRKTNYLIKYGKRGLRCRKRKEKKKDGKLMMKLENFKERSKKKHFRLLVI